MRYQKGCIPWTKGKHHSEDHKHKISDSLMGHNVSEDTKNKIGSANNGNHHSDETKLKIGLSEIGEKHHNWHGGVNITYNGYIYIYCPTHPNCVNNAYVLQHRLVMEEFLGRYLTRDEVVHHINGIKDDNRPENLMLFANQSKHSKYHHELRRQKMFNKFYGGILRNTLEESTCSQLNNAKILDVLDNFNCRELLNDSGSAVNEFDTLATFMQQLTPKPINILEIGTFMGIGTAVLASYSEITFTFDIWYRNAHQIWDKLNVLNKINSYAGDQKFIDDVIKELSRSEAFNFNFGFIDGMHKVENVRHDFQLVKFCDRVLFHDAHIPEIKDFILNEIGGIILKDNKFGYWEKK